MENVEAINKINEFSKKFSAISAYLGYKKFENEKPKVLLFDSEGWLIPEIVSAFKILDLNYETIKVNHLNPENKDLSLEDYLKFHKNLIQKLLDFKPDCILTVNHAAFDSLGLLTKILEQFSIPFISWFVDSPLYIFKNPGTQKSKNLYLFCWEKHFLERLQKIGFENLFYLPLAADVEIFFNPSLNESERIQYECDVLFVGHTNQEGVKKWESIDFLSPALLKLSSESININLSNPSMPMHEIIMDTDKNKVLSDLEPESRIGFEAFCILKATEINRKKIVKLLSENFNLKIFGDWGWKDEFPKNYIKPLDYFRELPKAYKSAKIVINITSSQMTSALNQRAFDVPLAGSLLISDFKEDFEILFGKDIVPTYRNDNELLDLIRYYLEDDVSRYTKRMGMVNVILEKHRYSHRLQEMFSTVKNNYKENQ